MAVQIQLTRGIDEEVSDVRLTRSKDGTSGTATFFFKEPNCTNKANQALTDITGMFMLDEEGELVTRNVNAKFLDGKPAGITAIYVMSGNEQWERFMRFMERYAQSNGMELTKKS